VCNDTEFLSAITTRPVYQTCPRPTDLQYILYWTDGAFQHHQLLVLSHFEIGETPSDKAIVRHCLSAEADLLKTLPRQSVPRRILLRLDRSAEEDHLKTPVNAGNFSDVIYQTISCVAGTSTPRQGGM